MGFGWCSSSFGAKSSKGPSVVEKIRKKKNARKLGGSVALVEVRICLGCKQDRKRFRLGMFWLVGFNSVAK